MRRLAILIFIFNYNSCFEGPLNGQTLTLEGDPTAAALVDNELVNENSW